MYSFIDPFPAPQLDALRWSPFLQGSVDVSIGSPTDGVYPLLVDDPNDEVRVYSKNKIYVPANQPFDTSIQYVDTYDDVVPPVTRYIYLGWRSNLEGSGNPLWGVDVLLRVLGGPTYDFMKKVVEDGVVTTSILIPDPTMGADGQFRIVRNGLDYSIYYFNGSWVLLDTITLANTGLGYVWFGVYAEPAVVPDTVLPWLLQP